MKNFQTLADKTAIGLSLLCTFHCLAFPLIIILLPSLAALHIIDEAIHFHTWILLPVVPISAYSLTVGCKQHKSYRPLTFGLIGVAFLILAIALGVAFHDEVWERILTVIGAGMIAYGHYQNYRLCQHQNSGTDSENDYELSQ